MTDVAAFRAGDDATFRALVHAESSRLLAIVRRYAQDDAEADDLLQQSWLAIYRSRAQFDARGSLAGWMMAVCRNTCLSYARRRHVAPVTVPLAPGDDDASVPPPDAAVNVADAINDAIAGLAPRERDVALLRLVEGLSTREVAERLGCAEGTVKATLHRATAKLRETLRSYR